MSNSQQSQLISTFHSTESSSFPLLSGTFENIGKSKPIRTEIWWRTNAYLAKIQYEERYEDAPAYLLSEARLAASRLQGKTTASWWITVQSKAIETIFIDLYRENHDLESGFLNC